MQPLLDQEYDRKPRGVTESFIEKIRNYDRSEKYDVMHNCRTGYDVIMRLGERKWQDDKLRWHSRDYWIPEMTIIHPETGKRWGRPPSDYWLHRLARTDSNYQTRSLDKRMKDMLRKNEAIEDWREQNPLGADEEYLNRQAKDCLDSHCRTTITVKKPETSAKSGE